LSLWPESSGDVFIDSSNRCDQSGLMASRKREDGGRRTNEVVRHAP
jgi:hypothetical protein